MVSDFVMTEHQCRQNKDYPQVTDSIGMGAYQINSHHVQRIVWKGQLKNEGDIQKSLGCKPYPISYRSIVPAKGEFENLLVPWCLSASHIAFGSIRMEPVGMEPVGMVLGQSAGTAASIAIDEGSSVQEVNYAQLRKRLLADGQKLGEAPAAGTASWAIRPFTRPVEQPIIKPTAELVFDCPMKEQPVR